MSVHSRVSLPSRVVFAAVAFASLVLPAVADGVDGVLTADVTMTVNGVFEGEAFMAVINPDASHPDKIGLTNTSGMFQGDYNSPTEFQFSNLPVYAIVNNLGAPWSEEDDGDLFERNGEGNQILDSPRFNLQHVGDLSLTLTRWDIEEGGYTYGTEGGGVFHCLINDANVSLAGEAQLGLPPSGVPNYLWYGMGADCISLSEYMGGEYGFSMSSGDALWTSGWPGATLDKTFFPYTVPEPGTLTLLALGAAMLWWRRRG